MRKFSVLIILLGLLLMASSCGKQSSVPSGRARKTTFKENAGAFRVKKDRKSKPPQMGFYRKRERTPLFQSVKRSIRYTFANKKKKHEIGNDKRASSIGSNKRRQKESAARANTNFVKGKHRARKSRTRKSDHTKDSFSKNPNKKKLFGGKK